MKTYELTVDGFKVGLVELTKDPKIIDYLRNLKQ